MSKLHIWPILIGLLAILGITSCEQTQPAQTSAPAVFPLYAKGFSWLKKDGYTILRLHNGADTVSYMLCPSSLPIPSDWPKERCIKVPVSRMVVLSATHVGMIDALGGTDAIIGLSDPAYLYSPALHERMEKELASDVGMEGGLNTESLLAMMPEVVVASAMPNAQQNKVLQAAGIPMMMNAEWMEQSLLARAEWIKVFALLLGKESMADSAFSHTANAYRVLVEKASSVAEKPVVLSALPYKGIWSAAGGKSYVSKLLWEAGGSWHWANDTSSVSLQLDFEAVYPVALKASYWLWPGIATSLKELKEMDSRFADFPSVKNGRVYNYNLRLSPKGQGNDYWESGVVRPDIVLADLIKILHPELLPEHELYYHRKLE